MKQVVWCPASLGTHHELQHPKSPSRGTLTVCNIFKEAIPMETRGQIKLREDKWSAQSHTGKRTFWCFHMPGIRQCLARGFYGCKKFTSAKVDRSSTRKINPMRFIKNTAHNRLRKFPALEVAGDWGSEGLVSLAMVWSLLGDKPGAGQPLVCISNLFLVPRHLSWV